MGRTLTCVSGIGPLADHPLSSAKSEIRPFVQVADQKQRSTHPGHSNVAMLALKADAKVDPFDGLE